MNSIDVIDDKIGKHGPRGPNPLDLLDQVSWNVRRVANNLETNNNLAEPLAEVKQAIQEIADHGTNLLLNYYDKPAVDDLLLQTLNDAKIAASQQAAETSSGSIAAMMIPINEQFVNVNDELDDEVLRAKAEETLKVNKSAIHDGPDGHRDVLTRVEHSVKDDVLKLDFLSSDVEDEGQQYTKSIEVTVGTGLEIESYGNTVSIEAKGLRNEITSTATTVAINKAEEVFAEALPKKVNVADIAKGIIDDKRYVLTDARLVAENDVLNLALSTSNVEDGSTGAGYDGKVTVGRNVAFSPDGNRTVKLDIDEEIKEREDEDEAIHDELDAFKQETADNLALKVNLAGIQPTNHGTSDDPILVLQVVNDVYPKTVNDKTIALKLRTSDVKTGLDAGVQDISVSFGEGIDGKVTERAISIDVNAEIAAREQGDADTLTAAKEYADDIYENDVVGTQLPLKIDKTNIHETDDNGTPRRLVVTDLEQVVLDNADTIVPIGGTGKSLTLKAKASDVEHDAEYTDSLEIALGENLKFTRVSANTATLDIQDEINARLELEDKLDETVDVTVPNLVDEMITDGLALKVDKDTFDDPDPLNPVSVEKNLIVQDHWLEVNEDAAEKTKDLYSWTRILDVKTKHQSKRKTRLYSNTIDFNVVPRSISNPGSVKVDVDESRLLKLAHIENSENITGLWTFKTEPDLPSKSSYPTEDATAPVTEKQLYDVDVSAVHIEGEESVLGTKTFDYIKTDKVHDKDDEELVTKTNGVHKFGSVAVPSLLVTKPIDDEPTYVDGTRVVNDTKHARAKVDSKTYFLADNAEVEHKSNKVTSLTSFSTDIEYPTAKAVYDRIEAVRTESVQYQFGVKWYGASLDAIRAYANSSSIGISQNDKAILSSGPTVGDPPDKRLLGSLLVYDGTTWNEFQLDGKPYDIQNGYMFYVEHVVVDDPNLRDKPKGWVIWSGKEGKFNVSYDRVQSVDNDTLVRTPEGVISVADDSLDESHFDPSVRATLQLAKDAFLRKSVPPAGNGRQQLLRAVELAPIDEQNLVFKQYSVDAEDGSLLTEPVDFVLEGGLAIKYEGGKFKLSASNVQNAVIEGVGLSNDGSKLVFTKHDGSTIEVEFDDDYNSSGD